MSINMENTFCDHVFCHITKPCCYISYLSVWENEIHIRESWNQRHADFTLTSVSWSFCLAESDVHFSLLKFPLIFLKQQMHWSGENDLRTELWSILPRTTSLAEAEALSTTVWAVHVYIPAWLSWAFTINRSPMFSFWKGEDRTTDRTKWTLR